MTVQSTNMPMAAPGMFATMSTTITAVIAALNHVSHRGMIAVPSVARVVALTTASAGGANTFV